MSVQEVLAGTRPWFVEQGDAVVWLNSLPADSVDLLFCSPPYVKARTYAEGGDDPGIARSPNDWVAWMLEVCEASRRVCKGLCAFVVEGQTKNYRYDCTPFLLLVDLHRRGFNLRHPVVYDRPGIFGGGGPDWWRNDWEPVVCFSRPGRLPWSDNVATGQPPKYRVGGEASYRTLDGSRVNSKKSITTVGTDGYRDGDTVSKRMEYVPPEIANPGNVIRCKTGGSKMGSPLAHENEAPFSEDLVVPFVLSFCPPGGVVCDVFSGSGTTAAVAFRNGRRAIACDLRQSQVDLSRRRIAAETPTMFP